MQKNLLSLEGLAKSISHPGELVGKWPSDEGINTPQPCAGVTSSIITSCGLGQECSEWPRQLIWGTADRM